MLPLLAIWGGGKTGKVGGQDADAVFLHADGFTHAGRSQRKVICTILLIINNGDYACGNAVR